MNAKTPVHFGPYQFDPTNACVWRGKQAIPLRPKAFAVLQHLLDHAGQLVTKDELFETVWSGVYVTDSALKECIREIRKTLSDKARTPQYIETVHRRGYRFVGEIKEQPTVAREQPRPKQPSLPYLHSPPHHFVGRAPELAQLQSWWEKARSGERQIVFLSGEAGIGKTTLLQAFLSSLPQTEEVQLGLGQCIEQYGAGEAYMPVLEALGRLCRQDARLIDLLEQHAPSWLVQMPALLETSRLEALQPRVAGVTQERMLREMAEVIEVLTVQRPLLLALEDMQWSDTATVELISMLARRCEPARLLVIGTFRLDAVLVREHPLQELQHELQLHGQCQTLPVPPLTETAVEEYFSRRLLGAKLSTQLARQLYQQTEGNPLFLLNTVDYVAQQGLVVRVNGGWELRPDLEDISAEVPGTLQRMIAHQLEYLPPPHQQLLEVASIAGATFSATAVAAGMEAEVVAVETQCETLARQEQFIQTNGVEEWPDGTVSSQYRFRHGLYQEVLAGRVGAARYKQLHQRIGERKETGHGTQVETIAGQLAVHYTEAGLLEKAIPYWQQAGQRAIERSAYVEASQHLTTGLALLKTLPDTPERAQHELSLQTTLGRALMATKGYAAPEVGAVYHRTRELCQQVGETPRLFPVLGGLYTFYVVRAEHKTALELAEQRFRLAQSVQDSALLMRAHYSLGASLFAAGAFAPARDHQEQGLALYNSQQHRSNLELFFPFHLGASFRSSISWTLWYLGYPQQALERAHEALKQTQELAHPFSLAVALIYAATFHQHRQEGRAVQELAEAAIPLCREQGFALYLAWGTIMRGWALSAQGRGEEGVQQIGQGITAWQTTGAEEFRPYFLALLAEAYKQVGQTEEGLNVIAEALAVMSKTEERDYEAELYRLKGELLLAQASKEQNEAEACFEQAIDVARQQSAKSLELRAVMSLAQLWQQQGKTARAHQRLANVYDWFTEGFDTPDLQKAEALLDALL